MIPPLEFEIYRICEVRFAEKCLYSDYYVEFQNCTKIVKLVKIIKINKLCSNFFDLCSKYCYSDVIFPLCVYETQPK